MKTTLHSKAFIYSHEQSEWPYVDAYETSDFFIFELDLPGCKPDEISLKICNNILTITGQRHLPQNADTYKYICMERQSKTFTRAMKIPVSVDVSACEATYQNGVLVVKLPKLQDKIIEIKIQKRERT